MFNSKSLNIFYSFITILGISCFLSTYSSYKNIISNNFVFLLLFIFYLLFISKVKIKKDKRTIIFSTIFSVFLSIILTVGACMEVNTNIANIFVPILSFIGLTLFCIPLINIVLKTTINIKKGNKIPTINIFIIIWIFGILGWLALYPGGYDYDAPAQLIQFMNPDYSVNTHFSVLFSYLEYLIVSLGYNIFGNYQSAIGLFTFLQMTIVSIITTYIITFISNKLNFNRIITILSILFFAIFPFHILLQVSCVQDTLFSCSLIIFAINLYKLIIDDKYFQKKSDYFSIIISGILLCLFRNNGIYIIIISLILSLLFKFIFKYKLQTKKYIICIISIILIYYSYQIILLPILGVEKGNSIQEMSSIPSQQLARVYNNNINAFSDEQLNKLNKFYPNCDFSSYNTYESISDGIKACLDENYTKKHLIDYAKLYISVGAKDPINYTKAFLLNTYGFWYPNKSYPDERIYHPYIEYKVSTPSIFSDDLIEIERNSKFPLYEKVLNEVLDQNNWQKIPVISSICSMGSYFILLMFIIISCIYKKKYKYIFILSLYISIYITLFLSPVALYRYIYPIMISLPLLILILIDVYIKDKKNKVTK